MTMMTSKGEIHVTRSSPPPGSAGRPDRRAVPGDRRAGADQAARPPARRRGVGRRADRGARRHAAERLAAPGVLTRRDRRRRKEGTRVVTPSPTRPSSPVRDGVRLAAAVGRGTGAAARPRAAATGGTIRAAVADSSSLGGCPDERGRPDRPARSFYRHARPSVVLSWVAIAVVFGVFAPRVETALSGAGWQANGSQSVQARA